MYDWSYFQEHNFHLTMNLNWGLGQSCVECQPKSRIKKSYMAPAGKIKINTSTPTVSGE